MTLERDLAELFKKALANPQIGTARAYRNKGLIVPVTDPFGRVRNAIALSDIHTSKVALLEAENNKFYAIAASGTEIRSLTKELKRKRPFPEPVIELVLFAVDLIADSKTIYVKKNILNNELSELDFATPYEPPFDGRYRSDYYIFSEDRYYRVTNTDNATHFVFPNQYIVAYLIDTEQDTVIDANNDVRQATTALLGIDSYEIVNTFAYIVSDVQFWYGMINATPQETETSFALDEAIPTFVITNLSSFNSGNDATFTPLFPEASDFNDLEDAFYYSQALYGDGPSTTEDYLSVESLSGDENFFCKIIPLTWANKDNPPGFSNDDNDTSAYLIFTIGNENETARRIFDFTDSTKLQSNWEYQSRLFLSSSTLTRIIGLPLPGDVPQTSPDANRVSFTGGFDITKTLIQTFNPLIPGGPLVTGNAVHTETCIITNVVDFYHKPAPFPNGQIIDIHTNFNYTYSVSYPDFDAFYFEDGQIKVSKNLTLDYLIELEAIASQQDYSYSLLRNNLTTDPPGTATTIPQISMPGFKRINTNNWQDVADRVENNQGFFDLASDVDTTETLTENFKLKIPYILANNEKIAISSYFQYEGTMVLNKVHRISSVSGNTLEKVTSIRESDNNHLEVAPTTRLQPLYSYSPDEDNAFVPMLKKYSCSMQDTVLNASVVGGDITYTVTNLDYKIYYDDTELNLNNSLLFTGFNTFAINIVGIGDTFDLNFAEPFSPYPIRSATTDLFTSITGTIDSEGLGTIDSVTPQGWALDLTDFETEDFYFYHKGILYECQIQSHSTSQQQTSALETLPYFGGTLPGSSFNTSSFNITFIVTAIIGEREHFLGIKKSEFFNTFAVTKSNIIAFLAKQNVLVNTSLVEDLIYFIPSENTKETDTLFTEVSRCKISDNNLVFVKNETAIYPDFNNIETDIFDYKIMRFKEQ